MNRASDQQLRFAYLNCRNWIASSGYKDDIVCQGSRSFDLVTQQDLAREFVFVLLNSGMSSKVIDKVWPEFRRILGDFKNLDNIVRGRRHLEPKLLILFGNKKKVDGIFKGLDIIKQLPFEYFRYKIVSNGIHELERLPFIGPVTVYHLAKNLGIQVAKPDRHLVRIAEASGFDDVQDFCNHVSSLTGDKVAVVDIVLWHWASITTDYLKHWEDLVNIGE